MFCPNCGANNPDTATVCPQCNQPIPQFSSTPKPPQTLPPSSPAPPAVAGPSSPSVPPPAVQIPNYLTQSIIMTVASFLCCLLSLPFSIIALVYSTQVNNKIAANDIAGAMSSSKNAKLFNWIAVAMVAGGALLGIVWIILMAMGLAGNILQQR